MTRYWHIAHPQWTPGQDLLCRDALALDGIHIEWLWPDADEGTDCDRVCLYPDTGLGREEAGWHLDDRVGHHIVRVDLPDDYEMTRAEWEPFPAVLHSIPAEYLTEVDKIGA
jgi:hypothetical protein